MTPAQNVLPQECEELFELVGTQIAGWSGHDLAKHLTLLVSDHDEWRSRCLNLMPAENTISLGARQLRASYLASRATEGFPGAKEWPRGHDAHIDQIEAILVAVCRRLFRARYVEWRTTSTTMANSVALFALTQPGDLVMAQSMRGGGNWNYNEVAIPRIRGLRVEAIPPGPDFGIDVDALAPIARRARPKFFIIGGTKVLFPYPLRELRALADEVGARILYDAAHVSLLISAGLFQQPLEEGADLMATGTHKIMGGPIGGLSVTNDPDVARRMLELTFPPFVQTHDQSHYAAAAYAFAEMLDHGPGYARQIVANAKALAVALEAEGLHVLARDRGYTMTHQVLVDLRPRDARTVALACEAANILIPLTNLPDGQGGEAETGTRISVQEVTRLGMRQEEMTRIARLIGRVARGEGSAAANAGKVASLVHDFPSVCFSFDPPQAGGTTARAG